MKFNFNFTVTARCTKIENRITTENNYSTTESIPEKIDIDLSFNEEDCENLLFKMTSYNFILNGYKVLFKFGNMMNFQCIILCKDKDSYIVTNSNQLINDVLEGYIRLRSMQKISDIMEFDFNTALDFSNIDDEIK